jgi:PTS system glucose-specific IIC component
MLSNEALSIRSPLAGRLLPLSEVPDATFADKILGDGFAIDPSDNVVYAPFDATVVQLFRTHHAIGLRSDTGIELLIHIGIDTVKMNGRGFEAFVTEGSRVRAGDKLLRFDRALVEKEAKSVITPVTITNMDHVESMKEVERRPSLVQSLQTILSVSVREA